MEKQFVVKNIIFLPIRFYKESNISMYSLLRESGYFELQNQISEHDISMGLAKNLECVDQWLNWSENKRTDSGWYINKNTDEKYVVGYFPNKEKGDVMEYINKIQACAAFIKREIEDILKTRS